MEFDLQYKRLIKAFHIDCQALITRFELTYNINFHNFCEIWRDMQFSLIFAYLPTETSLIMFCKKALNISKQFLINGSNLKECIGALYLLYGVYYKINRIKQTKELKIRMTLSDWNYLMELHNQIKKEEYIDANYILCKLIIDNAFIHCISDSEYGIEKHSYINQEKPILDVNLMPGIKDLAEPGGLLSTISKLSEIYEKKKNILYSEEESGLQLYDSKVADDIIKNIRTVQSENRTLAKSNTAKINLTRPSTTSSNNIPGPTALSSNNTEKSQKRTSTRNRTKLILAKIGQAFEKGLLSGSDEEQVNPEGEDA